MVEPSRHPLRATEDGNPTADRYVVHSGLLRPAAAILCSAVSETTREDAALVEAARAGDSVALSTLLERYQARILRFGMRMCKNTEDAREVAQETLLAAARGLGQFRGQSSLSTWLFTIARSYCIKKRRKSKFAPKFEESLDDDRRTAALSLTTNDRSPEETVMARELEGALRAAIEGLEPMYKEVLVLRDVEGLTATEVSAVVGSSVGAVKSRLHRARAALRVALLPYLEADERQTPLAATCPDIVDLFSRSLEGELSTDLCQRVQTHVDSCPRCKQQCDSINRVIQLCRTDRPLDVPSEMRAALNEAIKSLLRPNRANKRLQ